MKPEDIVALLTVCDLSRQWSKLSAIHDRAMATLLEVNADAQKELAGAKAAKAKADAAAAAKVAAAKQAQADADAKKQADMDARAAAAAKAPPVVVPPEQTLASGTDTFADDERRV